MEETEKTNEDNDKSKKLLNKMSKIETLKLIKSKISPERQFKQRYAFTRGGKTKRS